MRAAEEAPGGCATAAAAAACAITLDGALAAPAALGLPAGCSPACAVRAVALPAAEGRLTGKQLLSAAQIDI